MTDTLFIEQSYSLTGTATANGAKNAVLVSMASLILTHGLSRLYNVPHSADVLTMACVLQELGATVEFDSVNHVLTVDTATICRWHVSAHLIKKIRASVLVMGPLLARFGRAHIAFPGGDAIGLRPVNYHLRGFTKMGATVEHDDQMLRARTEQLHAAKIVLEYPSVGATENIMMAATLVAGTTTIVNAALEPEVVDLIMVLKKMGASIEIAPPACVIITGVEELYPINHAVMLDRLEAGALLLAGAATGGDVFVPDVPLAHLDMLCVKLDEMGHSIYVGPHECGVGVRATKNPRAVSFKTGPFPGFPTDLQAPMMALQCVADGVSVIEETVFENRLLHVRELQKMGANISVEHNKAVVTGTEQLYGTHVIASDIRASCALAIAGLVANGSTVMTGVHHWQRGFESLEKKLSDLGARITLVSNENASAVRLEHSQHPVDQIQE